MGPTVIRPGDGERFERKNRTITIRSDLPHVSILEIEFDDTFVVDPHTHDDHTDSFYVLEGEVEFTVGDDAVRVGPGTVVSVPPGARHGFRGVAGTARVLNFHAPETGFTNSVRGG